MTQYRTALSELNALFDNIDDAQVDLLVSQLQQARKIVVFGAGRERLQIMGLAMRLFHLGLSVSVVGDMTTPAIGKADLLLFTCGPGELSTVTALSKVAKDAGAQVVAIAAQPAGPSIQDADFVLCVPAQTMANDHEAASVLPMGSLYEGALFILFEVLVLRLKDKLGISADAMRANHTNME